MTNNTISGAMYDGIYSQRGSVLIANNTVINAKEVGIYIFESRGCTVFGNAISGSGEDGVYLQWGSAVIANNTISGTMGVGIFLYETRGSAVTNNTLSGNGMVGIYLSSSPAYLDGNRLTDCSIALWFDDFYNEARFIDGTNITSTNTINGLPVYFLENKNMDNATMGSGWGEVILLNVTYLKVSDLSFSYGGVIAAWSVNVTVEGNTFDNAADAVYLYSSVNCSVADNHIIDPLWDGVDLGYCTNDIVIGNSIVSGTFNNEWSEDGIYLYESWNNTVSNNAVTSALNYGIYLSSSDDNTLFGNSIIGSTSYGIYLTESYGNMIYNNTLTSNNGATSIWSPLHEQAYDDGGLMQNHWNDTTEGNYWSDWLAPDNNHDRIVDVPYAIAGGEGMDYLPIANRTALDLVISTPVRGTTIGTPTVLVTGMGDYGTYLVINGVAVYINENGTFSVVLSLVEGNNVITATETRYAYSTTAMTNVTFTDPVPGLKQNAESTNQQLNQTKSQLGQAQDELNSTNGEVANAQNAANNDQSFAILGIVIAVIAVLFGVIMFVRSRRPKA